MDLSPSSGSSIHGLRSGDTPWLAQGAPPERDFPPHAACDAVIVGAGITGACLAERLSRRGLKVIVLDRHAPERGSTAASTALLLWELDEPLQALEQRLGFERAAAILRHLRQGIFDLAALVRAHRLSCGFAARGSLYMAGDRLDDAALREEARLRQAAGLGGRFLDEGQAAARGLMATSALQQDVAAEADPVALAAGLMRLAQARGALLFSPLTAVAYDATARGIALATDRGTQIEARALILASGYDMPPFVPMPRHRLLSTWAIATTPLPPEALWPDRSLIWEASEPYLYLRTTPDGRIIAGGADEPVADPAARAALTDVKTRELRRQVAARLPGFEALALDYAWSGLFGITDDGLPLIGPVPGMAHCHAAFGYGGNGILFAALAAEMLDRQLQGGQGPKDEVFALDRAL